MQSPSLDFIWTKFSWIEWPALQVGISLQQQQLFKNQFRSTQNRRRGRHSVAEVSFDNLDGRGPYGNPLLATHEA